MVAIIQYIKEIFKNVEKCRKIFFDMLKLNQKKLERKKIDGISNSFNNVFKTSIC